MSDFNNNQTQNSGSIPVRMVGGLPADPTNVPYVQLSQPTYQLLGVRGGSGATSSGPPVGPVQGGSYILRIMGTFGGATAQLKVLEPDGVTFANQAGASFTSATTTSVVLGSTQGTTEPNIQMTLTGATGTTSLWCSLT